MGRIDGDGEGAGEEPSAARGEQAGAGPTQDTSPSCASRAGAITRAIGSRAARIALAAALALVSATALPGLSSADGANDHQAFTTIAAAIGLGAAGSGFGAASSGLEASSGRAQVTPATASFGIERAALTADVEDGAPDSQAGSHPYELTAEVGLNQTSSGGKTTTAGSLEDLYLELPPGLSIDPNAVTPCSAVDFSDRACPNSAAVGVAQLGAEGETYAAPVYELQPAPGEPMRFGFVADDAPLVFTTAVRTGGDYGITASVRNVTQAVPIGAIRLTLWGVPAAASHDSSRGSCLTGGGSCPGGATPLPFLALPTACASEPQTTIRVDSWQEPGASQSAITSMPKLGGCDLLPFEPAIEATPEVAQAGETSGYQVAIKLGQNEQPAGLATSELDSATITLPEGVSLSPASVSGLIGCSEAQIALASAQPGSCPQASAVGTVELELPPVAEPVKGHLFWASADANPFGAAAALYLEAEDAVTGLLVKIPVGVEVSQLSGQLAFSLQELPQLPFSEITLQFFGGPNALLVNPGNCGVYVTEGELSPWSGSPPAVELLSPFAISGCHGPGPETGPPIGKPVPPQPRPAGSSPSSTQGASQETTPPSQSSSTSQTQSQSTDSAPSTPPATDTNAPPKLQELEQKMEALQVSSERFMLSTAFTGVKLPSALKDLIGDFSVSGEATTSPQAGNLIVNEFGHSFRLRVIGETTYLYLPEISRADGDRPWIKLERNPFGELLTASSGPTAAAWTAAARTAAVQADAAQAVAPAAASKPPFAGELKLIREAGDIKEVGATTVDGEEVTHFTASFNPSKIEKAPSTTTVKTVKTAHGRRVVHLPAVKQTGKLELFIAPSGLPVRTVFAITTSVGSVSPPTRVTETVTLDLPAINFPLVVEAPPAAQTISLAAVRSLERKLAKHHAKAKKR